MTVTPGILEFDLPNAQKEGITETWLVVEKVQKDLRIKFTAGGSWRPREKKNKKHILRVTHHLVESLLCWDFKERDGGWNVPWKAPVYTYDPM